MNLQINILYDSTLDHIFVRDLQRCRVKVCKITNQAELDAYKSMIVNPSDYRLEYHIKSCMHSLSLEGGRRHALLPEGMKSNFPYAVHDSHAEIEKLGYQSYYNHYCILLTLDNCLDIVLNACCGADPINIRRISNYDFISFAILNTSLRREHGVFIHSFKGYDSNLDNYIDSCYRKSYSCIGLEEDMIDKVVLETFFSGILNASAKILMLTAMQLYKSCNLSLRSQSFSSFVFGAVGKDSCVPENVMFQKGDLQVKLPLYTLQQGDYFKYISRGDIL